MKTSLNNDDLLYLKECEERTYPCDIDIAVVEFILSPILVPLEWLNIKPTFRDDTNNNKK
jgi:hypothetical protein